MHDPNLRSSALCRTSGPGDPLAPTIFHEPWWLDAASDGRWRETIVESGGRLVGRLPYVPDRKITGHVSLVMPLLTRSLGPAIHVTGAVDNAVRQPSRHKIVRELVAQLPKASHIWMQMHGGVTDVMAFEEIGCKSAVGYTTEIAPATEQDLWAGMRDKTRNVIRRAHETENTSGDMTAETFHDFYDACARERGRANDYGTGACRTIVDAALAAGRGRIHSTHAPDGSPLAAILTVWDEAAAYYLMSARSRQAGNGSISLLVWNAIREAASHGRIFDTDGLSPENQTLLTGFGGVVRPRLIATRTSLMHGAYIAAKKFLSSGGVKAD